MNISIIYVLFTIIIISSVYRTIYFDIINKNKKRHNLQVEIKKQFQKANITFYFDSPYSKDNIALSFYTQYNKKNTVVKKHEDLTFFLEFKCIKKTSIILYNVTVFHQCTKIFSENCQLKIRDNWSINFF